MPLQEVGPRLGEEDDRLGRLALGEEERLRSRPSRLPLLQQFQRRPRHAGISLPAPVLDALADQVDQAQLVGAG